MVNIAPDVAPAGQVFDKWVGQTDHIGNIYLPYTVIVMPLTDTEIIATYRYQGATQYSLTVTNGDGDGVYLPGEVVNIVADIALESQVFDKWVGQTANIANINLPNTSIRIPFSSVTVIATYKDQGATPYTLTVTNGEGGGKTYQPGSEVNIAENAASTGYVFEKWTEQTNHVANINLSSTTISMPFSAATAIAIYKAQGVTKRDLTVYSGDGSGSFLPGTVVDIVADVAPAGKVFDKWVGQTSHIANINMPNTTVSMPFSGGLPASVTNIKLLNIIINMLTSGGTGTTVEATYKDPGVTPYKLTVTKGTGGGLYI